MSIIIFVLSALLLLAVGMIGCGARSAAEWVYAQGNAHRDEGELEQAIAEYTKAIGLDPKLADAYHNRGNAYHGQGKLDQAIAEWFSRYVIAWHLSITLHEQFCREALEASLQQVRPDVFNTNQGVQFTAIEFTQTLEQANVRISMARRGRALDNIFVERLWRTIKYENVYLMEHATAPDLITGLTAYFHFYNYKRLHQSLGYCAPASVHHGQQLRRAR